MEQDKNKFKSPLLSKYLLKYQEDPTSRVFAPLAEVYRKSGMVQEAIQILKQGVKLHPNYPLGFLGLAQCFVDQQQYELAYKALKPWIDKSKENILMQKLFGDICLKLFKNDEALEVFKFVLFLNPKDLDVADKVKTLEKQEDVLIHKSENPLSDNFQILETTEINSPMEEKSIAEEEVDFNWVKMDLAANAKKEVVEPKIIPTEVKIIEAKKEEIEVKEIAPKVAAPPIITLTLVDLYLKQGHAKKAKEILEKIIEKNPTDQKCLEKLSQINQKLGLELPNENEGRNELMEVFDQRFGVKSPEKNSSISEKYRLFLQLVKDRANNFFSTSQAS